MRQTLLAAALLVLSSCTASKLQPDDKVAVTGKALGADGQPLSQAKVVLYKEPDIGQVLFGMIEVTASWGAVCFTDNPPDVCASIPSATTDGSGAYAFSMLGKDTTGSGNSASTFDLTIRSAAQGNGLEGAAAQASFIVNSTQVAVPNLKLWDPAVSFAVSNGRGTVNFGDFQGNGRDTDRGTGFVFVSKEDETMWSANDVSSGDGFDLRMLEDTEGTVMATAHSQGKLGDGDDVAFSFRSQQLAYPVSSSAPPSRGAACFIQGESGPVELSPCTLTDGHFAQGFTAAAETHCTTSDCTPTANTWAEVDLGESRSISLVVVRGASVSAVIEVSTDASNWTQLGTSTGALSAISPVLPVQGRYVRVRATDPHNRISGLSEISVW